MQFAVIIIVLVVVIGVFVLTRSRRSSDGVAGFRREIDALSSDARRPTIDRGTMSDDAPDTASRASTGTHAEPDSEADAVDADADTPTDSDAAAGGRAAGIDPGFIRAQDETETPEADPNGT